jgi:Zn-dependent protease
VDLVIHYLAVAVIIALIIYSIVLHEIAHAYMAYRLGDPGAVMLGRLTLNPIKHVDPFMTIALPLLLLVVSGGRFAFGGAKPVPVFPHKFRKARLGMMLTGIAGPAVNITIMLACALLLRVPGLSVMISLVLAKVGWLNLVLFVFNLVPIPPLDGSRVVAYFLPYDMAHKYNSLGRYGMFLVLIFAMTDIFEKIMTYPFRFWLWLGGPDAWLAFDPLFG